MATWNAAGAIWETAEVSLLCGHSARFSEPWPTSGWMRDGRCFAPPTSVRPTSGSDFSSPRGLPTPKARDAKGPDPKREDLGHAVTLLKTPTSNLGAIGGSQHPDRRREGGHGPNLSDEVEHLLPTPKASDGTHGGPNSRGSKGDLTLPSATAKLHPAPQKPGRRTEPTSLPPLSQVILPIWEPSATG
ncbi:hypothetical protein [Streptomyces sp. CBMA123]|uniref:hypothetical protein n=1 Tax=Streptomyces sp. CBMA123 TaxID=1896313 RepID=UPI001D48410B|nr:hypothetical protein [Streptomyces sp. CBMA123]MBD0688307.1 hypothetical protein [Streptomyces sp. CBMA123]